MVMFQRVLSSILFVGVLTFGAFNSEAQDKAPSTVPDLDGMHMKSIQNPPQSAPSFTLTISTNASEFRVGSRISISVIQKNITNHTIDRSGWYSDTGDMSYSFDVRDEDGKPAEKIVHQHPEMDTPGYYWNSIPAGESYTQNLQISKIYKFDRPGKYIIQVFRPDIDFKDNAGNFVKSEITKQLL